MRRTRRRSRKSRRRRRMRGGGLFDTLKSGMNRGLNVFGLGKKDEGDDEIKRTHASPDLSETEPAPETSSDQTGGKRRRRKKSSSS